MGRSRPTHRHGGGHRFWRTCCTPCCRSWRWAPVRQSGVRWPPVSWGYCLPDGSPTVSGWTTRCAGFWWPVVRRLGWPGFIRYRWRARSSRWRSSWARSRSVPGWWPWLCRSSQHWWRAWMYRQRPSIWWARWKAAPSWCCGRRWWGRWSGCLAQRSVGPCSRWKAAGPGAGGFCGRCRWRVLSPVWWRCGCRRYWATGVPPHRRPMTARRWHCAQHCWWARRLWCC